VHLNKTKGQVADKQKNEIHIQGPPITEVFQQFLLPPRSDRNPVNDSYFSGEVLLNSHIVTTVLLPPNKPSRAAAYKATQTWGGRLLSIKLLF